MDIAGITAFVVGFVVGIAALALLLPSLAGRTKRRHQVELEHRDRLIGDLRQEQSEDRETNRRLRHRLAIDTPHNFDIMREERDVAVGELDDLIARLRETRAELDVRDRSLREARLAIHDIRVQLERNRHGSGAKGATASDAPDDPGAAERAEDLERASH